MGAGEWQGPFAPPSSTLPARAPPVGSPSECLPAAQGPRGPNPRLAWGPGGDGGAWQLGIWMLGWRLPLSLHRRSSAAPGDLSRFLRTAQLLPGMLRDSASSRGRPRERPGARPAAAASASAYTWDVTGTEGSTGSMETVVIVAIGVLATIFLASFAALVVVCRQGYCRPRDLLQRYDSKPIVDLIGAMETQSEPSELELDDVVITNPHIEAILENEDWIEDASGLMSHCIAILKICHTLTEKLVAMTMGSGSKMKTSASVSDIIVVAKRISPRVDDVVKSMYPPLDPKLLDARTTALLLSVSHLVLVTRNACHLTGGLDWIDQSLSAAEEHLEVLREAALASQPEKGLLGPEGFLQEQSAI